MLATATGASAVSECQGLGRATPGYFLLVLDCGEPADVLQATVGIHWQWHEHGMALVLSWVLTFPFLFRNRYA